MSHKRSGTKFYGLLRPSQIDGKLWRKKGSAHDPKHNSSSPVKHSAGSVMAWAGMAASGVGSLLMM